MNIKNKLSEIGLTSESSIVIGSGILNVLNLRESKDIDIVVTEEKYRELLMEDYLKKNN